MSEDPRWIRAQKRFRRSLERPERAQQRTWSAIASLLEGGAFWREHLGTRVPALESFPISTYEEVYDAPIQAAWGDAVCPFTGGRS